MASYIEKSAILDFHPHFAPYFTVLTLNETLNHNFPLNMGLLDSSMMFQAYNLIIEAFRASLASYIGISGNHSIKFARQKKERKYFLFRYFFKVSLVLC